MFGLGPATRIYLAAGVTDMRKGFEGLYGLVRDRLSCEPLSGHLFLFCNGQRKSTESAGLRWDWPLGLCQEIKEGTLHLAARGRRAGQGSPESRRAVLIVRWHRSGQNQAQAVVPEGSHRRGCGHMI